MDIEIAGAELISVDASANGILGVGWAQFACLLHLARLDHSWRAALQLRRQLAQTQTFR